MKVTFALLCFFTLLSQGWAMDDHQMTELMVGTWQAVGQEQMYNGIARYVVSCTYTEDGRFDATWSWVFPPTPGQARLARFPHGEGSLDASDAFNRRW